MSKLDYPRRNAQLFRPVVNALPLVVNSTNVVVNQTAAPVVNTSRHGVYADLAKRRAYQREWMRKKRAQVTNQKQG